VRRFACGFFLLALRSTGLLTLVNVSGSSGCFRRSLSCQMIGLSMCSQVKRVYSRRARCSPANVRAELDSLQQAIIDTRIQDYCPPSTNRSQTLGSIQCSFESGEIRTRYVAGRAVSVRSLQKPTVDQHRYDEPSKPMEIISSSSERKIDHIIPCTRVYIAALPYRKTENSSCPQMKGPEISRMCIRARHEGGKSAAERC
jgi:hypothetical protein